MNLGIAGKKALVTGAGRGIGRSVALCLAKEGVKVAAVSRTQSDLDSLIKEVGGKASGHIALCMDLVPDGSPTRLVKELKKAAFGSVDIIVHNLGGTLDINDPLCPVDSWRKVWRFNVEVAIELNQLIIPGMRERKWGRIVHISSISSVENQGPPAYCAAKAALNAYVRSLGRYLAPDGLVLSVVLPGAIMTEGGYWDIASRERPEHVKKYLTERMAIQRFGQPEEISHIVAFLCSQHASFCIGSIVPADGGQGRSFFGY